jgi:HK97 family phage major capsid protein
LIDQSPIAFDDLVFRDLVAAHAAQTDQQVIPGTGANGQVLGIQLTPGITTIAVSAIDIEHVYGAIANAVQTIHTTRFLPPEVIVMYPRRWGWFLSLLDASQRPLFLGTANAPMNVAGVLTDVASQQIVGSMHGLPVVTDPNIPVTQGTGNNEDPGVRREGIRPGALGGRNQSESPTRNQGHNAHGAAADLQLPGVLGSALPAERRRDYPA